MKIQPRKARLIKSVELKTMTRPAGFVFLITAVNTATSTAWGLGQTTIFNDCYEFVD